MTLEPILFINYCKNNNSDKRYMVYSIQLKGVSVLILGFNSDIIYLPKKLQL